MTQTPAAASPPIIPEQRHVTWAVTLQVSWAGIKRRFFRSLITMSGVVLAIAFLTYMQVMNDIVKSLILANDVVLNAMLQKAGVDIYAADSSDRMMILLIILSLMACLVGIINSMLMSVTERIKEIGTLKCLGALDGFIIRSYFIESSLQGVAGTVLGCILGLIVALAAATSNYHGYVMKCFPWLSATGSLVISLLIGTLLSVVAAILPAYLAAKKQPVDAMRVEE
ncbi:MAG TPA: FtsX-like permease family protein [Lentisphaeria bacterium]|nr:FtsX-like permease family protein [Lentisphaeria bacterium]